jgi:hypothetical protein
MVLAIFWCTITRKIACSQPDKGVNVSPSTSDLTSGYPLFPHDFQENWLFLWDGGWFQISIASPEKTPVLGTHNRFFVPHFSSHAEA